jgi:isoleucyl-tRNA synthetase
LERYEQLLPLALPYQNPENAFRVISGDFVTMRWNRNRTYSTNFGADDAKVAKEATPEVPPMLVLMKWHPVPLVDLRKIYFTHG